MSICINSSTPCISPIAKNTPYFLILPLIFTIAKNYSLVLNFTPYFHEQGVKYSFGKTLARALGRAYNISQVMQLLADSSDGSVSDLNMSYLDVGGNSSASDGDGVTFQHQQRLGQHFCQQVLACQCHLVMVVVEMFLEFQTVLESAMNSHIIFRSGIKHRG